MARLKILKFKSNFYIRLIGFISIVGALTACSSSKKTNNSSNNGKDTIVKDSIIPNNNNMQMKYGVPVNYYDEKENPPKK
jgi:hypothetical protein